MKADGLAIFSRHPQKTRISQRTDTLTPQAACLSRLDLAFQHRIKHTVDTREQKNLIAS